MRIHLAYKGTNFRGYAENPGVRTVGGELRKAIEQILGTPIDVTVAGRTDAGVHAQGQVISFRGSYERLAHEQPKDRLNSLCPADITIQSVSVVDDEFDARFSALHREYRYRILNSEHSDPLYADLEWHIPQPLNLQAMEEAATCLLGTHDFTSFCRRPKGNLDASMTRKILAAKWEPKAEERVEFVEQLNSKQYKEVEKFFSTMPKLSHKIEITNPNTKKKSTVVLEGLADFFG